MLTWDVRGQTHYWKKKRQTTWLEIRVLATRLTPPGELKRTSISCNGSIFCPYLRPSADSVPGRCPCQEEVCTQGGSCPGWPYLEQRDKHHDTVRKQANTRKNKQQKKNRESEERRWEASNRFYCSALKGCKRLRGQQARSISGDALHLTVITSLCFDW